MQLSFGGDEEGQEVHLIPVLIWKLMACVSPLDARTIHQDIYPMAICQQDLCELVD